MPKTVFVCGLEQSGKTAFILALAKLLANSGRESILLKPFEKNIRKKYADETETDAERFGDFCGVGGVNLHNLFSYQGSGPLAFLAQSELNPFKFKLYEERIAQTQSHFAQADFVFVELSGSLEEAVDDRRRVKNLVLPENAGVVWLASTDPGRYGENLLNAKLLSSFPRSFILLNNPSGTQNAAWLQFLWSDLQEQTGVPVPNMLNRNDKSDPLVWRKAAESCIQIWDR